MGVSIPLRYWGKYWVQLYLEVAGWLKPSMQARAEESLRAMHAEYGECLACAREWRSPSHEDLTVHRTAVGTDVPGT